MGFPETGSVRIVSLLAAAVVAACAIRPLPGDGLTGKDTIAIVNHVRCEARAAVAKVTINHLDSELPIMRARPNSATHDPIPNGDPESSFDNLVRYFSKETGEFKQSLKSNPALGAKLEVVEAFASTVIGYKFTLTAREENNLTLSAKAKDIAGGITLTLGPSGQFDRSRQNKREFIIIEQIAELALDDKLLMQNRGGCNEYSSFAADWSYPISGGIGLHDTFATFSELILRQRLGKSTKTLDDGKGKSGTLSDTITFVTTLSGTLDPKIVIASASTAPVLVEASASATGKRVDTHELFMTLQNPEKRKPIDETIDSVNDRLNREIGQLLRLE